MQRFMLFFTQTIWQSDVSVLPGWKSLLYRQARVLMTVVHEAQKDNIFLRASALTFFSMLSVVPVLALAFGIAKGFGLEKDLRDQILTSAVGQEEIINKMLDFASKAIDNTAGGLVAGLGLLFLLFTVLKLLNNIEASFNEIWGVTRARTITRKLSDYLAIMLVSPILFLSAGSMSIYISSVTADLVATQEFFELIGPVLMKLIKLTPYILVWLMFIMIYLIMPNTQVRFKSALIGGVIAGTCFVLLQYFYIGFQVGAAQANAIYGSFAALPLFLIWLNLSWIITLLGAEISFAHQTSERFQMQSWAGEPCTAMKRKSALLILQLIVKRFAEGEVAIGSHELAEKIKLPESFVDDLLKDLISVHVVSTVQLNDDTIAYQPGQDIERLTIASVMALLDAEGDSSLVLHDSEALTRINETLNTFYHSREALEHNYKLKDV
ncbi:MAG: YihY/virulence factor BrkB family protein [Methylococcales bacterium]|jgi:membrane protein|nr:YihY/virulence factor BrkB family protein [Methylococcales bacterium]